MTAEPRSLRVNTALTKSASVRSASLRTCMHEQISLLIFPSYFQMMLFVAMAWWCGVQSNFLHKMSSLICTIQRASKVLATEKIYNKQEKLICICRFTHSLSPCETLDNCSNLFCDCLAQSNSTSQKDGCNSTHHAIHESVTEICTCITSHIICPIISKFRCTAHSISKSQSAYCHIKQIATSMVLCRKTMDLNPIQLRLHSP